MTSPASLAAAPFYVTGGTLPPGAPSYVTRQADEDLFAALQRGDYCYVLNARQMGKSSLCVRTIARLRQAGLRTAFLDLTKFGGRNLTAEQWYAALLSELGRELNLRAELLAFWKAHPELPPVQRLFGALTEAALPALSGPVVVFVDEIDVTRSLPFSTDEFFAAIRQLYVGRATEPELARVRFCLLGTATPADLIEDTRVSPFNIGRRIELRDFTPEEAAPLAAGLGPGGERVLNRILYWTNGHPYLTQRLCRAVVEATALPLSGGGSATPTHPHTHTPIHLVDRLCRELFLTHTAREADDNLALVRNRLLKSEVELAGLLELYGQVRAGRKVPDDETDPRCAVLKLSGVASVEHGRLRVRNRIYGEVFDREWIAARMPDAEVQRQRAAYRQGLLRAAALAGAVVALLGSLTVYAIHSGQLADQRLYVANMNLIQREWETGNDWHALELLNETKSHPGRGFEWGYWQRVYHPDYVSLKGDSTFVSAGFSPDGQQIVTGSYGGIAKIWDTRSGRELRTLKGHTQEIESASFSPDGQRIVTGSDDETAKVWDARDGRELLTLRGHTNWVTSASFSPDGQRILTGSFDGMAKVWDARSGRELRTLWGHDMGSISASFFPDGQRILTGSYYGTAIVWDASSGRQLFTLEGVTATSLCPDGQRIVTAGFDGMPKVWDARTGRELPTRSAHTSRGRDLLTLAGNSYSITLDGRWIVTESREARSSRLPEDREGRWSVARSEDSPATVWNVGSVEDVLALHGLRISNDNNACNARFSPDGQRIVAERFPLSIVWEVSSGRAQRTLKGQTGAVFSAGFSPDGDQIVTGSEDGTAKIWRARDGRELLTLKGHTSRVTSASFSPDGQQILTGSFDGMAKVWDARSGRELLTLRGHTNWVTSASFSPDGQRILTGSDDETAKVWDASSGLELHNLKRHTGRVTCVAFSSDSQRIVTGSRDHTTKLWDASTGGELRTFVGGAVAGFSRDGQRIVTGAEDGRAEVWDGSGGRRLLTLQGHTKAVTSVGFSPDGQRIVTASEDGTARIWDGSTGRELLSLIGHTDSVCSAAFSPDGKRIVTSSLDGTVKVWPSEMDDLHVRFPERREAY